MHFGVREHAMGAAAVGMLYHGGLRPFVATFFVFSDYMRPPLRLAALGKLPLVAVFTHDSIGVGEDGPTHQPIEHLAALRAMPNLAVLRPADANETAAAWRAALARRDGPSVLVLSRQALPTLPGTAERAREGLARGAYVVSEAAAPARIDALILATGSEVHLAVEAQAMLERDRLSVRVVSMPCWELFEAQDARYRESVLPALVRARVSIEAGASLGWQRWVGDSGVVLGIDRFGASAPGAVNFERYGMTREALVAAVRSALERVRAPSTPSRA